MNKVKYIVGLSSLSLLFLMPFGVAEAADIRSGSHVSTAQDVEVDDDLYMFGGSVSSSGTINGDMTGAGGTVTVSGIVSGSVMTAGGSVTVISDIEHSLRVVGGTVTVSGSVGHDSVAAAGMFQLTPGTTIGNDLVVRGGTVIIDGNVERNVFVNAEEVVLNGNVGGDVEIITSDLTVGNDTFVGGDLIYSAPEETDLGEATIEGEVIFTEEEYAGIMAGGPSLDMRAFFPFAGAFWLLTFISSLVAALVIGLVFRKQTNVLLREVTDNFWGNLLRGFVVALVVPVVMIIAFSTLFASSLGLLLGALYGTFLFLSHILSGVALGALVTRWSHSDPVEVTWKVIAGGVTLMALVSLIPVIGWFVVVAMIFTVFGAFFSLFQVKVWGDRR